MIIDKESKDVVKSEELSSIKYSIDSDNFGLLFKMLRDNLYQNKEYTIIREYVSNAIDAHTEAGVDKPVLIEWVDASELMGIDTQLKIVDFGCGLSPDRVTNIFGKYLSSTKRSDNQAIGGFGIGSKSAFSYTDSYYVKTYYDSIEYHYNCYIDEDDLGSITLMFQQPTDRGNGTEIIIPVKQRDKYLFEQAITKQLLFCNIEVKNMSVNLQKEITYEDEDFILTNRSENLRLLNGKILYDIDLRNPQLEDFSNLRALEGVVVKCNIGEVKVTLSREDLDYTGKTIELLKSKFVKVKEKLKQGYIESISNCKTFREFNNLLEKQIKPKVQINKYDNHKIFVWKDFEDVVFNNYRPFRLIEEGYYAQIVNKINSTYWNIGSRKSYTHSTYFYSYTYEPNLYTLYQEDGVWDKEMQEWLGTNARAIKVDIPSITPQADLVADLVYFCEDVMKEVDALPKLSEKREEFLAWRKEQRKLNKVANVRLNGTYPVSKISYSRYSNDVWWHRDEVKLTEKDLADYVFIGNQDDKERLESFLVLCKMLLAKTFTGYIVSVPNTKHFTQRRAIHIKDIMKDHPVIRNLVTNIVLNEFSDKVNINSQINKHRYYKKEISPLYANILEKLDNLPRVNINSSLATELKDLGLKHGWYNRDIKLIEHYNNFMKGVELFKYVELTEESLPLVKQYLMEKGKIQQEVPVNQLKLEEIND